MSETLPRRFIVRDRDDHTRILLEGCQWSNGGISTLYHEVPWAKSTNGLFRALADHPSSFDFPGNVEQVEILAATIWGELHWLDKSDEELRAAAQAQADLASAAWTKARDEMHEIFFGARRPWGEPVRVVEDANADVPIAGDFSAGEPEEDSENESGGRRFFEPGTVVYVDDEYHITSSQTGIPVGIIGEDGEIAQHGQVIGFVPSLALFEQVAAQDEDLKTLMAGLRSKSVEITFERVDTEVFNLLIGPVNCKHCGKPVKATLRMGNTVWVHDDLGTSEYCSFRAEPDLPIHEDEEPA